MEPQDLINAVTEASANRQYQLLGALFILGTVMVLRKLASKRSGKIADFVNSDLGGVVLSLITSAAGAAYTMMKNGAAFNANLVLSVLGNAALASGVFTYGKHARRAAKSMRKPKAPPAAPAEPPKEDPTPTTTMTTEVPK